jgi:RimJ/RimL family protein N-acetyltransferase
VTDAGQRHLVIEVGGRPVGYVILGGVEPPAASVELRRIVVAEKGRGVGRAAVARVARYAFRDLGAREVWLEVVADNHRARHVYRHCGFEVDPTANLSIEIQGVTRPLVKMTLSCDGFEDRPRRS